MREGWEGEEGSGGGAGTEGGGKRNYGGERQGEDSVPKWARSTSTSRGTWRKFLIKMNTRYN